MTTAPDPLGGPKRCRRAEGMQGRSRDQLGLLRPNRKLSRRATRTITVGEIEVHWLLWKNEKPLADKLVTVHAFSAGSRHQGSKRCFRGRRVQVKNFPGTAGPRGCVLEMERAGHRSPQTTSL